MQVVNGEDDDEAGASDAGEPAAAHKPNRDDLLLRLRAVRGRLPANWKFDRDEANAR